MKQRDMPLASETYDRLPFWWASQCKGSSWVAVSSNCIDAWTLKRQNLGDVNARVGNKGMQCALGKGMRAYYRDT